MKHHCNAVLEDRYPSTIYFIRHKEGFFVANICSSIAFVAALTSTIFHLLHIGDAVGNFVGAVLEMVMDFLVSVSIFVLGLSSLYPSLNVSMDLQEKQVSQMIRKALCGLFTFTVGNLWSSIVSLVFKLVSENNTTSIYSPTNILPWGAFMIAMRFVEVLGSIILVVANWPMKNALCRVLLLMPSTWENVFHPSNYLLLASILLLVGSCFKISLLHAVGYLAHSWAFCVLLLHWNMAFYVWESMNLQEEKQESHSKNDDDGDGEDELSSSSLGGADTVESYDVLISGGGISGLFLACILGKLGIRVILCKFYV